MTAIKSFNEVSFDELMDIAAGGRGFYVESDDDGWEAGYEDDHIHVIGTVIRRFKQNSRPKPYFAAAHSLRSHLTCPDNVQRTEKS
jgi:hypothetical protein